MSTRIEGDKAGERDREEVGGLRALIRTWLSLSEMESPNGFEQASDLIAAVCKELEKTSTLVGTAGSGSGMSHTLSHS